MARQGVVPLIIADPHADSFTQPFWTAALDGKLTVQECLSCGTKLLPAAPRCPICQADGFKTTELPGTGTIYSYIIVRHPLRPDLSRNWRLDQRMLF